jgi:membrane-bound lytic murein transglycosylase D
MGKIIICWVDRLFPIGYYINRLATKRGRESFLKKGIILITGFLLLMGPYYGLAEARRKEVTLLEPVELIIKSNFDYLETRSFTLLDPDSWKEFFPPQDGESIQSQCEVLEPELNPARKEIITEEPPIPASEGETSPEGEKTLPPFNRASGSGGYLEFPADTAPAKLPEKIGEEGPKVTLPLASEERNDFSGDRLYPIEGTFPQLFSWEESGSHAGDGDDDLPAIAATFPSLFNERVEEFIDFFQTRGDFFRRALGRSQAYEEMMKRIFREKNLPEELFYLALIESGFNPKASSRAKASGIWQFIKKTARRFGLKVDKWVDERRDPEKSTYAAAEYLKNLYEMFNNWDLVAASYNAGEGKVLRAMKRAKSQDFWEISQRHYLKTETRKYVPMFLAAVIIASAPQKYGFSDIDYHPPLLYERVVVPPATRLDLIAKAAETDLSEIQALNPALKRGKTPPNYPRFEIKLPSGKKEIFERNFLTLTQKARLNAKIHRIRPGETLGRIAKKYRVNLQELCRFNEISPQDRIMPGSCLLLPR